MSELRGFNIRQIVSHLKYGTGFGAYDFTLYHAYTIVAYPGASAVSYLREIVRVSTTLPLFHTIGFVEAFVCLPVLGFIMKKSLLN